LAICFIKEIPNSALDFFKDFIARYGKKKARRVELMFIGFLSNLSSSVKYPTVETESEKDFWWKGYLKTRIIQIMKQLWVEEEESFNKKLSQDSYFDFANCSSIAFVSLFKLWETKEEFLSSMGECKELDQTYSEQMWRNFVFNQEESFGSFSHGKLPPSRRKNFKDFLMNFAYPGEKDLDMNKSDCLHFPNLKFH
jgi:hypothetical protein